MYSEAVPNVYNDPKSAEVSRQHAENRRHFGAITVSLAAEESGATVQWLTRQSFLATLDDRRIQISRYYGAESVVAWSIERDKILAKKFWNTKGISVPPGRRADSADDAVQVQAEMGAAVVVKPVTALGGAGVTVNVSNPQDVRDGFLRAEKSGTGVLVEKYIEGNEYRAHATPEECVGVFRRVLPNVTGDGHSTIRDLIKEKNRVRQLSPATKGRPIPIDGVTEGFLRRRRLSLDSVVENDQTIVVRDINSLTSGGDTQECLDTVGDDLRQTAVAATAAIPGMNWAGVDIIIEKSTGTPYVMEINTNAMTVGSIFPVFGTPRNLAKIVFQKVWEHSRPESTGAPLLPSLRSTPIPISQAGSLPTGSRFSLENLLKNRLEQRGYWIVQHNRTVWSTESADSPPLWFSGVHGESDLRLSTIPLTKIALRQELLKAYGVPVVESLNVPDLDALEEFRRQAPGPVAISRANSLRPLTSPVLIEPKESIDKSILNGSRRWVAHEWIHGTRLSIIASPERAFAVLGGKATDVPTQQVLDDATALAVSAVRALPQLNWAVVDVVCPIPGATTTVKTSSFVERLSANPTFGPESTVIAGSIDRTLDLIIDRATHTGE